jgi:hypothetical protein
MTIDMTSKKGDNRIKPVEDAKSILNTLDDVGVLSLKPGAKQIDNDNNNNGDENDN